MSTRIQQAKPEHEVAYQDICALVNKHAGKLTPLELLAIGSNMIGKLVAMQDQRVTTPEMAMEVVSLNLQKGNQQVLEQLGQSKGAS